MTSDTSTVAAVERGLVSQGWRASASTRSGSLNETSQQISIEPVNKLSLHHSVENIRL